jgi:anthranilate phosphoribosyltransferase
VGVWGRDVQGLVAGALAELGARHALVVHSDDGLDELSVTAPTTVLEVRDGALLEPWRADPAALGLAASDPESLQGGTAEENAARLETILGGGEQSAAAEAVAFNAAAALYVAGRVGDLGAGVERAREVLRSGAAAERLRLLAARSRELAAGG